MMKNASKNYGANQLDLPCFDHPKKDQSMSNVKVNTLSFFPGSKMKQVWDGTTGRVQCDAFLFLEMWIDA